MPGLTAGYVLTGGRSSRFGSDKALLDWHGRPLVLHVAEQVRLAAGGVTLVGAPERYGHLGLEVIADSLTGAGPLAGVVAALTHTDAAWNLITACDMPGLTTAFLGGLLEAAAAHDPDIVLPHDPRGRPEPLCAVYHARCRPTLAAALGCGIRKMTEAFGSLRVFGLRVEDAALLANVNTPADLPGR